jgi:FkbM family methyltransferase
VHSHPATRQDTWVTSIAKAPGVYLEIGAYDGIKHSNTLYLQQEGWTGLLVEGNPNIFERLVQNRPLKQCRSDTIVGRHLDEFEHKGGFVNGDQYGGLYAYMPDEWKLEHHRRGNTCITVTTTTIDEFWEREGLGQIDYLSLDTEGSEYTILKSFSHLDKVVLLTVEFRYDDVLLKKYCDLLEPTHRLDQLRGFDACFIRKGLWSVSSAS